MWQNVNESAAPAGDSGASVTMLDTEIQKFFAKI